MTSACKYAESLTSFDLEKRGPFTKNLADAIFNDSLHASLIDNLHLQTVWDQIKPCKMHPDSKLFDILYLELRLVPVLNIDTPEKTSHSITGVLSHFTAD